MQTKLLILFTFLYSTIFFSQNYEEQDIFVQNKEGYMIVKPNIEQNIRSKTKTVIDQKLADLISSPKDQSSKLLPEQIEFAKDTLTINEFMKEYSNYNTSGTTFGMNVGIGFYTKEYDKLLNKYYKKDLEILQPEMKKQLINSQKKWLDYYNNDKVLIGNLMNFGNHNYLAYAIQYTDKMLTDRVQFLYDIYEGKMQGTNTYKED